MEFTKLEKTVLRNYLPYQNAYDYGQCPMKVQDIGNKIWDNEKINLENKSIKGIVGSLVKKEILVADDSFIWLDDIFRDNEKRLNKLIIEVKN